MQRRAGFLSPPPLPSPSFFSVMLGTAVQPPTNKSTVHTHPPPPLPQARTNSSKHLQQPWTADNPMALTEDQINKLRVSIRWQSPGRKQGTTDCLDPGLGAETHTDAGD